MLLTVLNWVQQIYGPLLLVLPFVVFLQCVSRVPPRLRRRFSDLEFIPRGPFYIHWAAHSLYGYLLLILPVCVHVLHFCFSHY